jgi:hypothetical protein
MFCYFETSGRNQYHLLTGIMDCFLFVYSNYKNKKSPTTIFIIRLFKTTNRIHRTKFIIKLSALEQSGMFEIQFFFEMGQKNLLHC